MTRKQNILVIWKLRWICNLELFVQRTHSHDMHFEIIINADANTIESLQSSLIFVLLLLRANWYFAPDEGLIKECRNYS